MFNKKDTSRDTCQLFGAQARQGYDWWWHSFTAKDALSGKRRQFFFEFFLCNPALGGDEPVFGQKLYPAAAQGGGFVSGGSAVSGGSSFSGGSTFSGGSAVPGGEHRRPSYLMVKAGCWGEGGVQLHRFLGWKEVAVDYGNPFSVKAGDCYLDETSSYGSVAVSAEDAAAHPEWMSADSGTISWKLKIDKLVAFNVGYGASAPMRRLQAFEMFWHAQGMKTRYSGEVVFNSHRYIVDPDESFGYADKNWGKNFTSPWLWLSSNDLVSMLSGKRLMDSVFDIGGGAPKVGPVRLRGKLLSAFWYEGRPFEFNFSKFWTFCRTSFASWETDDKVFWHVDQSTPKDRMVTDVSCLKKDMLLVHYESPDGLMRHDRLWNGGNGSGVVELYHKGKLVDRIKAESIGCEYGEYDHAATPYLRRK